MSMTKRVRHMIATIMAAVMTTVSLPIGWARADMVTTKQMIAPKTADTSATTTTVETRERVRAFLARDDVRAEMIALGVSAAEAEARVAALTERELALLAGHLDQVPAGEGIGSIIGIITIVFFVLFGIAVVVDALGMLNLFPFVCGPGECGQQQQVVNVAPGAGPPDADPYQGAQAPAYQNEPFQDPDIRRQQQGYRVEQPYQPQYQPLPEPAGRNYYEERYGTQRQVR